VLGGSDGTIRVCDTASGALAGEPLRGHEGVVWTVAMSAKASQIVALGMDDDGVCVWAKATRACIVAHTEQTTTVQCPSLLLEAADVGLATSQATRVARVVVHRECVLLTSVADRRRTTPLGTFVFVATFPFKDEPFRPKSDECCGSWVGLTTGIALVK
jgi:WD40 repeat protein